MSSNHKKTFLQGAIVLGAAGIVIKLLGAVFRIPLANLIGDTGMGYYNSAYPIYVLFLTLSTAGIPVAISKLVSERLALDDYYGAHRIFKISFILLFVIGLSSASVLFFGAGTIVKIIGNPGAYYAMMAVAPALLFVPIMAAYRGYFQGMQNMKPTAGSQIAEQLFRVAAGLGLAMFLFPVGVEFAAAGASSGATFGGVSGSIFIIYIYLKKRKAIHTQISQCKRFATERVRSVLYKIFIIAVPVTIGASVMPIMNMIDVSLVMRRLQDAGYTEAAANSLYGQLAGMAGSIINFPQVLTMGIAMSLVPAIAAAYQRKDTAFLRYNTELGVRCSMIIGMPCAFGIMTLSMQIMLLLYPMQKASAVSGAPCLFIMAFGVLFLSGVQTLTGVLQGLGKPMIPVRNLIIGGLFKIAITYYLTGIASINVKGAAVGTVVAYMIAATLNLMAVKKYTGVQFNVKITFLKPLASALVMSGVVYVAYKIIEPLSGNAVATVLGVAIGGVTYLGMLIMTKGVTSEEIKMMPKGQTLARIIEKIQR